MSIHAIKNAVISRFSSARLYRSQYSFSGASIDTWFDRTYRMYNKIHHPEEVARERQRGGIDITNLGYYPFGALKVDAARVFVDGTYAHAIDAPFVLEPTRNPQLNDRQKGDVAIEVARLMSSMLSERGLSYDDIWSKSTKSVKSDDVERWIGEQTDKFASTQNDKSRELAREAATFRADYIADQLDFGGWVDAWPIITHNLMAEPYTAMCAREDKAVITQKWQGRKVKRIIKIAPSFRAIDPRNIYISSDAVSAQDGSGVTELTKRTRADLIAMYKTEDESLDKSALLAAINKFTDYPDQNNWLEIKGGLGVTEAYSLVHQGLFSGKELATVDKPGYPDGDYFNVTAEVCQNELIRFEVLPYEHNMRNYYTAQHTKNTSSYAGESILTKLYTLQNQLNIAMILRDRNYYMSSGPTVNINTQYFDRPSDLVLGPYSKNMMAIDRNGANRGFEQIEIQPHYITQDSHIENLKRQGDEMCGVVSGMSGLPRSGITRTTLGGAVLDQTAGERMMNAAILNLDRSLIEPMVGHLDSDNMQFDEIPKAYMRGDVVVRGKGINGLREIELRGRLATEALPIAMQGQQSGQVPDELLQGAYKQYFDSKGVNTSSMPSQASRRELNSAMTNPRQTNDGRTYNPQQPMTGVS